MKLHYKKKGKQWQSNRGSWSRTAAASTFTGGYSKQNCSGFHFFHAVVPSAAAVLLIATVAPPQHRFPNLVTKNEFRVLEVVSSGIPL
ncbi:hypothetical protein QL285_057039 [Trifolium repens]|nr:hypothetical protein QL285_057039 [Trifolium repens]